MLQVSTEVMNVEKNTTVSAGKNSSYKAVADYDVVVAVKKAEMKYGIISIPVKQELVDTQVMSYTDSYGNQKTQFVDIVKVTMNIINADDPEDYTEVSAFGRGIDTGDKGFGKASTYARKYCLLNAYKIATGEDPDKDASQEVNYRPAAAPAPVQQPIQQPSPQPQYQAPAQLPQNGITVETAIAEANAASDGARLSAIWDKYKAQFGKDVNFVKAIANSPVNPKSARSTK